MNVESKLDSADESKTSEQSIIRDGQVVVSSATMNRDNFCESYPTMIFSVY